MKTKLSVLGATLLLALGAGVGSAHADVLPAPPPPTQVQESTQSQEATNTIDQEANSTAVNVTGEQTNVNGGGLPAPEPVAAVVPNGTTGGSGDVEQSNTSGAESSATNVNYSNQSVDQDQGSTQTQTDGSDCGCTHGGSQPSSQTQDSSQDQSAENEVDQEANSTAVNVTGAQLNVNAPVRVLSPGDSEVNQSNESGASSSAGNKNVSTQEIEQDQDSTQTQGSAGNRGGEQEQSSTQNQSGENKIDQDANSTAINVTGAQTNVNAPVVVLGRELSPECGCVRPERGEVNQSNSSGASSSAWNVNHSNQSIDQGQSSSQDQDGGSGCRCTSGDQTQNSSQNQHGKNKVDQEANSTAINVTGVQTNVNQPIRVLSPGSDDVNQSNSSGASSSASNWNWSDQSIGQDQDSTQTQTAPGGSSWKKCGCEPAGQQEQTSTQNQSAENKVEQEANSTAINVTGHQTNVNGGGFAVDSLVGGGGSGDVDQSNSSGASSRASNWNWSDQSIDQSQTNDQSQSGGGGRCCGGSAGDQTQSSTQDQHAKNKVDQEANSTAFNLTGSQTNVNGGGLVPRAEKSFCGCPKAHGGGDVDQSNSSGASSRASNWNWSDQSIGQDQDSTQTQTAPGGSSWKKCGCEPAGTQEQTSTQNQSAENKVEQEANSTAINLTGEQTNVNGGGLRPVPEAATFVGGNHGGGDVDQSNSSGASSNAWNANWSNQTIHQDQTNDQSQTRTGTCCEPKPRAYPCGCEPKKEPHPCYCEPKKDSHRCGCEEKDGSQEQYSTQNQSAENKVDQEANSTAFNLTGEQTNVNGGATRTVESFCGCGHGASGDVEQSNSSGARSSASNWNRSTQAIRQRQTGIQRQTQ